MIKNCPICGKAFDVLWPELWRYVRKNRYLCSWKCIRLYDKEKKEEEQMKKDNEPIKRLRMSKDDMAEAVRLWRENDPGLEQYLKDHGINHIGKWKQNQKLRYGKSVPAATVKVDGPIRNETPETNRVEEVEVPEKKVDALCLQPDEDNEFIFQTVAVRNKKLGTFYYDEKHGTIDWRNPYGEEISLHPEDYRLLRDSIDMILHTLGVKM